MGYGNNGINNTNINQLNNMMNSFMKEEPETDQQKKNREYAETTLEGKKAKAEFVDKANQWLIDMFAISPKGKEAKKDLVKVYEDIYNNKEKNMEEENKRLREELERYKRNDNEI